MKHIVVDLEMNNIRQKSEARSFSVFDLFK